MKTASWTLALGLLAGAAQAQDSALPQKEEELAAAILKTVEGRLKTFSEQILSDVKKLLDEHFSKTTRRPETQPIVVDVDN